MKIMFVGGGRRVSLAKRFIAAGFNVFSYEVDNNCPINELANIVIGKKWSDEDISQHIVDAFESNSIDVAIPLQDHATTILSRIASKTATQIPTASEYINNICLDKRIFEHKLKDFHFYPKVSNDCEKVIIKPAFGFASKGIKIITHKEFKCSKLDTNFIAQRFIDGGYEISVDAYFNKKSKMVDAVPRRRLEVQGGEVSRSVTLNRESFDVVEITRLVGEKFGLIGPTCFQYIIDNNKAFIMEVNARFGGGVILSLEAGFDMVDLIKQEYIDNIECIPTKYNWKNDLSMIRYFQEHFYE